MEGDNIPCKKETELNGYFFSFIETGYMITQLSMKEGR